MTPRGRRPARERHRVNADLTRTRTVRAGARLQGFRALLRMHSPQVDASVSSPYVLVEDVAERLCCSVRSVHELARLGNIPHRRIGGTRRLLFRLDELQAWEDGADLVAEPLPRGGRVVRPVNGNGAG